MHMLQAGNSCNLPEKIGKVLKCLPMEEAAALPAPFGEHQLLHLRLLLVSPCITLNICFKLIPVSRWIGRLSEVTRPADDASEDRPSTELICNPRAWQKADGHCCDNLDFPSSHVGINLNLYIFTTKRSYKLYPRLCHLLSLDLIKKQYYQLLFHWWRNMQNEQN